MLDQASFFGITVAVLSGSFFIVALWLFSVHVVMVVRQKFGGSITPMMDDDSVHGVMMFSMQRVMQ